MTSPLATARRHLRSLLVLTVQRWFVTPRPLRNALLRRAGWTIGDGVFIHFGSTFRSSDVTVGAHCYMQHECLFEGGGPIVLGERVYVSSRVHVMSATHHLGPSSQRCADLRFLPTTLGDGCWIGAGAVILAGVTIGPGCVIAAGAVVIEDCEPDGLYAGVPAKRRRDLDPDPPRPGRGGSTG